jgi:hypothetical protein
MSDSFLQKNWKNIPIPLFSFFELLKNLVGASTGALQNFFVF